MRQAGAVRLSSKVDELTTSGVFVRPATGVVAEEMIPSARKHGISGDESTMPSTTLLSGSAILITGLLSLRPECS